MSNLVCSVVQPGEDMYCELEILDYRARVRAEETILDELRGHLPIGPIRPFRSVDESLPLFEIRASSADPLQLELVSDSPVACLSGDLHAAVPLLESAVTGAAIAHLAKRFLLYHAGAVSFSGRGIILPASSGSGKTTLVAGLVHAGFQYFTDDISVVEPASGLLFPFARSLRVKPGALEVLRPLFPELAHCPQVLSSREPVFHLLSSATSWRQEPVPLHFVVTPRYIAGAETRLEPLPRSAALPTLLEQSFNTLDRGWLLVSRTVEMLRKVECYMLTVGDLHDAVEVLRGLIGN
jgi:hypothetical protein